MSANITNAALLQTAIDAAKCGGEHALQNRNRRKAAVKTFAHDIKLELDIECQTKIEDLIFKQFTDHYTLGEEDTSKAPPISECHPASFPAKAGTTNTFLPDSKMFVVPPSGGSVNQENCSSSIVQNNVNAATSDATTYQWIIDPIDGTVNFSNGLPTWCCSVAVRELGSGTVKAAAVYAPMLHALYYATSDGHAYKNDEIIQVSECPRLADGIVMTGMDKNLEPGLPPLTYFRHIAATTRKARINGSAALDLCWVAEGAADGYFEGSIYLWDIAAAGLIVERAGGKAEVFKKRSEPHQLAFIASNGHVHAELHDLLLRIENDAA